MSKKYEVWFSFGVTLELDDPDDISEVARLGRDILIDRIQSDSIGDNIDDIIKLEDE